MNTGKIRAIHENVPFFEYRRVWLDAWGKIISQEKVIATLLLSGVLITIFSYFVLKSSALAGLGISTSIIALTNLAVQLSFKHSAEKSDAVMRQNITNFLLSLAAALTAANIILILEIHSHYISVSYILNMLIFQSLTLVYINQLDQKAQTGLAIVTILLFLGFIALAAYNMFF